jgi:hypothetical protein
MRCSTRCRRNPNRQEHEQLDLMATLGLPDFETWQQCSDRQRQMARRFKHTDGHRPQKSNWKRCEPDVCACAACLDGCWFASRHHRYQMITEAHRLFATQTGDVVFVTVAHPKWELPIGHLDQANIYSVRQWLYRRLKQLGTSVVALGGFEVSLNVDLVLLSQETESQGRG